MNNKKTLVFPLLLVLYEIATYLSNDMYLPALPEMMRTLQLNSHQAQLTLTSWFMGGIVTPLFIGPLSDRFGRRPILLWGGVIYVLSTIACAITSDINLLLIARFIQGSMVATMLVPGYAAIHESYDTQEAVRILAIMGMVSIQAAAFGPLIGSLLLPWMSWRGIFIVIAIFSIMSLTSLYYKMPETHPLHLRSSLHVGQLARSYWRIITNKTYMVRMMTLGFIFCGFIAWLSAGPLLVISAFDYSPFAFGVIQAVVFSVYMIGMITMQRFLQYFGGQKVIQSSLLLIFVCTVASISVGYYYPQHLLLFIACLLPYPLGAALAMTPLNRLIIEASDEPMGARMSIFSIFFGAFASLGSGLASLYYDGTILSLAYLMAFSGCLAAIFYVCDLLFLEKITTI